MRSLTNNEISAVSGADYSSDVMTAAASIYVGSFIGGAASTIAGAACTGVANIYTIAGATSLAWMMTTTGQILSPVMYFAAPIIAFETIYPGVIAEKIEPYFR